MSKNLEVSALLDFYGQMLTDKQREAVEYYYNDDLSLGEIAENIGISRQGVRDSIKRAETVMFDMEKKLRIAEKTRMVQKSLDTIRANINIIDERNMKIYRSDVINESIKVILNELGKLDSE